MADGYLNFDTKINENGFNKGISNLSKIATTGLGVAVGNAITKVVDKVVRTLMLCNHIENLIP